MLLLVSIAAIVVPIVNFRQKKFPLGGKGELPFHCLYHIGIQMRCSMRLAMLAMGLILLSTDDLGMGVGDDRRPLVVVVFT